MDELQALLDYYVNLLIIQYHNRPKAKQTIALFVRALLADGLLFAVRDAFDLNTATGTQLDIIGLYVGVDRFYRGQEFNGFFAFTTYTETTIPASKRGFTTYADFDTLDGKTLQYSDVISQNNMLPDEDYRLMLKLGIIQNNINHAQKSIDDSVFRFFGSVIRPDSDGQMNMFYFVPTQQSLQLGVAIQKKLLPKPMGVSLLYTIKGDSDFFGFATYDGASEFTRGFATYATYETAGGATLTYDKLVA